MPSVCIDCRYIGPRPSGIARVVQALVDLAPALAPELDFLLLRSPAMPVPLSRAPNVRETVVAAAANGPATMWYLPRIVDLGAVDLFHATFNIMPAGLAMPCVTTVHDIMWLTDPAWCTTRFPFGIERRFYRHGITRALDRAAAITTVSAASRTAIAAYAPHAAERVTVTPLGVSSDYRPVAPAPGALAALGLSPDRRFVLCVGQYVPYKNHEGALRIFAAAALDRVDLVFVQRRDRHADDLRRLAVRLGVADRVHFLPVVAQDDLTLLFGAAALLLHPSYCEGFGLPLVEAMACGCPVVTSDRSAMAEVVGTAGLLADPDDVTAMAAAVRRILLDPALAASLAARGQARAADFQWRSFAKAHVALYRRLV